MPRPPAPEPFIRKNLHIPESLAARVELRLWDPTQSKARYGAWSKLIVRLLQEWDERCEAPTEDPLK